ncbi:MAG: shikimate kinase [Candidatus Lokiarchaeota archaeon]|nr:shikimate kinase [Candidatus Lokiarchaeota archaeon]
MPKDSIALIGFMATGKSVVGKALKDHLGKKYNFIETDLLIERMAGKSIPNILSEDGEALFREYELKACKEVAQQKKSIISCGGGVVLNKENIEILKQTCQIVLLTASPEEIYNRAMKDGEENRPIIDKEDPYKEIERILLYREPYYKSAAEIIIDTTEKSIERIVAEILTQTKLL